MASLALFAAGSAIGAAIGGSVTVFGTAISAAAIGGFVGGTVGAYIDQNYLFAPKGRDVVGPRIQDYQLAGASEGAKIHKCFGPEQKVTGNVIWLGEHNNSGSSFTAFEERSTTQKVGGKGGGSSGSSTTFSYYADVAIHVCEGPINAIRIIWADSKVIYATGTDDSRYEGLTLYTGGDTSPTDANMTANTLPNSHIEAFEGAGNVPRYKNSAYFVLDSLQLTDFGNRLPTFSALVEVDVQKSVAEVIDDILTRAGLSPSQWDTSRVKECFTGYHVSGPISSAKVLEPILQAYDILLAEVNGVLTFFHRGDEQVVIIDEEDLGTPRDDYPATFSDINDFDTPSDVRVSYIDANVSYDRGEAIVNRIGPATPNVESIQVPMVITPSRAATIAQRRLYRAQVERLQIGITVPPSYNHVTEGDKLTLPVNGETYTVMVLQKDRGADGVIELRCAVVDDQINEMIAEGLTQQGVDDFTPYVAPIMVTAALSLPALIDAQALAPTYLVASSTPNENASYRGATVYEAATDTDASFASVDNLPGLSVIGTLNNTLGGGVSPDLWDYGNTIDVTILRGELESVTEEAVLQGQNHCVIGGEIIGFQTATLVSANRYTLSNLLRGRRHTFDKIDTHTASEQFVFLDSGSLFAEEYSPTLNGLTRYYRTVANSDQVANATTDSLVLGLESVKPFSPTNFVGTRDGSNNLLIDWDRRSRAVWDSFSAVEAPNYEGQEVYELDILSGSGGTVVRTISIEDATEIVYTAAEQTADGLTPGDPIYFQAYMLDAVFGRGFSSGELTL